MAKGPFERQGRDGMLKDLKGMIKGSSAKIEPEAYLASLNNESDRGAIILAATLIDDALIEALSKLLSGINSDEADRLFGYRGPLGTFSSRIILAQGLGIYSRRVRKQIEIIKEMRNIAAHAHLMVDFNTPQIRNALQSIFDDEAAADIDTWDAARLRHTYIMLCAVNADYITEHGKTSDRAMPKLMMMLKLPHPLGTSP